MDRRHLATIVITDPDGIIESIRVRGKVAFITEGNYSVETVANAAGH